MCISLLAPWKTVKSFSLHLNQQLMFHFASLYWLNTHSVVYAHTHTWGFESSGEVECQQCSQSNTLLEEKVLYGTLKGSIRATYLEPLKGSIHS